MAEQIDIIITTRNRLDLLKRTLERILKYTRYPHRIHVIDDASEEGNSTYLIKMWKKNAICDIILHRERCGIMANTNMGNWLSFSDPTVFVDDDILCPGGIEPCWLKRGVKAMADRPELGLLALNHPGAKRKVHDQDDEVTYCAYIGGTFMFARRKFLNQYALPHTWGNFGHATTQFRSQTARRLKWKVGYLTETFCYHMGKESANGSTYRGRFVEPIDWVTLNPGEKWIWRKADQ